MTEKEGWHQRSPNKKTKCFLFWDILAVGLKKSMNS